MISDLEQRLSNGFQFIDLNNKKWFMKPNGTVFALDINENKALVVLYSDTVMNAAIRIYNVSEEISFDQSKEQVLKSLASIIQSI